MSKFTCSECGEVIDVVRGKCPECTKKDGDYTDLLRRVGEVRKKIVEAYGDVARPLTVDVESKGDMLLGMTGGIRTCMQILDRLIPEVLPEAKGEE